MSNTSSIAWEHYAVTQGMTHRSGAYRWPLILSQTAMALCRELSNEEWDRVFPGPRIMLPELRPDPAKQFPLEGNTITYAQGALVRCDRCPGTTLE
jgi:hypothetical protein